MRCTSFSGRTAIWSSCYQGEKEGGDAQTKLEKENYELELLLARGKAGHNHKSQMDNHEQVQFYADGQNADVKEISSKADKLLTQETLFKYSIWTEKTTTKDSIPF